MNPDHISSSTFKLPHSIDVLPNKTQTLEWICWSITERVVKKRVLIFKNNSCFLGEFGTPLCALGAFSKVKECNQTLLTNDPNKRGKTETGPLPSFSNKFSSSFFSFRDPDKPLRGSLTQPPKTASSLRTLAKNLVVGVGSKRSSATFYYFYYYYYYSSTLESWIKKGVLFWWYLILCGKLKRR